MTENPKKTANAREPWKVTKMPAEPQKSGWLETWRRRREPSTYHRCLAVHIHFASPRSGLS
jgi:hypothetical protein